MKENKQMHIITVLLGGQGLEQGGWRWPGEDKSGFINEDVYIEAAKIAERGKLDGFFLPDTPAITGDISRMPPQSSLDPVILLSLMAKATEHIGLIPTISTSFSEPYTIARTLRSLDLVSKGRAGWNLVTTNNPQALLNYFPGILAHEQKHERSVEIWQAVCQLWGSWSKDALKMDAETGLFADETRIKEVDFKGKYVTTRGPLNLPPSPQGMPVVFTAGGGQYGFDFAATKADAMYSNPPTLEHAKETWKVMSRRLAAAGRNTEHFTIFNGVGVTVASTEREALERRMALDKLGDLPARIQYLGYMLGVPTSALELDSPIPSGLLRSPNMRDARSPYAFELAKKGFTIREILAHGPINYHPIFIGTPESIADKLQQWFEAGVGKGFAVYPDSGISSLTDFVEQVVPILQRRGLFRKEYTGTTLREHLGLPYRNGDTVSAT